MEMASSAGSWLSGCLIPLLFLRLSVHVSGRTGDTSKFHVALLGGTAELLCPLSLWPGTVPKEVRWLRSPFPQRSQVVHMFRDGKDQDEDLMPEYKGRTVLVRDAQEGSVTLQILDVRLEDQGSYRCLIQVGNLSKEDTVILQVAEKLRSELKLKRAAANSGWRRARLHFVAVTLDPETAHPKLILSEDQRCVRLGDRRQPVPDNPQRFDFVVSILGSEYFTTGCHYWEVYVGHKTKWILGVCSESVSRKGKVTASPANGHWLLRQSHGNEYEALTSPQTSFRLKEPPRCVGIFLDYEAGVISFYNVTNKSHIFTFTHSFSGPLRPFFEPCLHDGGKNTAPLVICSELHKSEESIVPKPEGKGHANGDVSLKVNSSLLPPKGPELKDIILSLPSDLGPALQGLKVPSF
ncbi:erythroid membrane-associated protein isoform X2 [Rhinopithecus roxellana]|uniref:erythroid membrane-associated protein isoform X2 n=1 Tax=Rhinopithecus roxellana TaxID=61622 RepID=UPI0012375128|nr:erythroid membrane-associated protein isoform X2 [Rhinopithecus roxellana]